MDLQQKSGKRLRRIIHFSDGSVPEYSTDEEESDELTLSAKDIHVNLVSFSWVDWLLFKTEEFGNSAFNFCDLLGDSLSSFFGITTPKYRFEIDHYNMMKRLENEAADSELGAMASNLGNNPSLFKR